MCVVNQRQETHRRPSLTRVNPLLLNVLLQASSEAMLAPVLAHGAVVHQQEVGVEVVQTVPLAQRVSQRLVGPVHLTTGQERPHVGQERVTMEGA